MSNKGEKMKMQGIIFVVVLLATSSGITNYVGNDYAENDDSSKEVISLSFSFSNPTIEDGIIVDNTASMVKNGRPILPYKTMVLKLPFGTEIEEIKVHTSEVKKIYVDKTLHISRAIAIVGDDIESIDYNYTEPYPGNWVICRAGAGIEGGEHVVFLSVHAFPVRYSMDEIEYVDKITVDISYTLSHKSIFKGDEYDLLIMCPDGWENELQTLKEHKESHGIRTKIVTLNEIYNGEYFAVNGSDNAEKVKYFIKNAVEQWGVEYVLIVGGFGKFPMRKSWVYDESETRYWMDIPIPTDLYYADIYFANGSFSSWDTNYNGYYGEFARENGNETLYDVIDAYPDVYIGRLACEDINEVRVVVDKIINYENNGGRWFKRVVCIAGDTSPNDGYGDVDEGIETVEKSLEYLEGFRAIKLYPSLLIPELRLNPVTITAAISIGCGFVHFDGHGNMVAWSTHPHNNEDKWIGNYVTSIVDYLRNGYKLPVIRIGGCLCGALDYEKESCLAWTFIKHDKGGGMACLAATRLSYGYIGKYCDAGLEGYHGILFFKAYEEGCTPAEMLANAQIEYMNTIPMDFEKDYLYDFKTIEEFILFGDPTLKIGGV